MTDLLENPDYFRCDTLCGTFKKSYCVSLQARIKEVVKGPYYRGLTDTELRYSRCKNCEIGKQNKAYIKLQEVKKQEREMEELKAKETETTKPENKEAEMNKPETTEKVCRKCNQIKDRVKGFSIHKGTADGYENICKACKVEMARERRARKRAQKPPVQDIPKPKAPPIIFPEKPVVAPPAPAAPLPVPEPAPAPASKPRIASLFIDVVNKLDQLNNEADQDMGFLLYGKVDSAEAKRRLLYDAYQSSLQAAVRLWKAMATKEV